MAMLRKHSDDQLKHIKNMVKKQGGDISTKLKGDKGSQSTIDTLDHPIDLSDNEKNANMKTDKQLKNLPKNSLITKFEHFLLLESFDKYSLVHLLQFKGRKYDEDELIEQTKKYIRMGVDVNFEGDDGCIPLLYAIMDNHYELSEILINAGSDLSFKDMNDFTPLLMLAYMINKYGLTKPKLNLLYKLIGAGSDWNSVSDKNKDFLYFLGDNSVYVIKKYPDKYEDYLIKKQTKKYNL